MTINHEVALGSIVITFDIEAGGEQARHACTFRVNEEDLIRVVPEAFAQVKGGKRSNFRKRLLAGRKWPGGEVCFPHPTSAVLLMALAAKRGESLHLGWRSEGSAFWLLHDIEHARVDALIDLEVGEGELPTPVPAEVEERATLHASLEAVRTGLVPVAEIIREMSSNAPEFERRFGRAPDFLNLFLDHVDQLR